MKTGYAKTTTAWLPPLKYCCFIFVLRLFQDISVALILPKTQPFLFLSRMSRLRDKIN